MMGPRQEAQPALFYEFSFEDHVPQDHLLRSIDQFVDLSGTRRARTADMLSAEEESHLVRTWQDHGEGVDKTWGSLVFPPMSQAEALLTA